MDRHENTLSLLRQGQHDAVRDLLLASGAPLCWAVADLVEVWRDAQREARLAYRAWRAAPGNKGYAVYRAAQDRADAAQHALSVRAASARAVAEAHA